MTNLRRAAIIERRAIEEAKARYLAEQLPGLGKRWGIFDLDCGTFVQFASYATKSEAESVARRHEKAYNEIKSAVIIDASAPTPPADDAPAK